MLRLDLTFSGKFQPLEDRYLKTYSFGPATFPIVLTKVSRWQMMMSIFVVLYAVTQ